MIRPRGAWISAVWVLTVLSQEAWAVIPRPLYRGARCMVMGGACVGLADDEQAIYKNPAGLAGIETREFRYMVADLYGGLGDQTLASDLTVLTAEDTGKRLGFLIGKDIYAQAQLSPTFVMPNFGVSYLVDQQFSLLTKNQALPQIEIGYQTTHGIQASVGFSLIRRASRKKNDFRVGFGLKQIYRRGGYRNFTMPEVFANYETILSTVAPSWGKGISGDIGFQYVRRLNRKVSLMLGSSYTEVGDIKFSGTDVDNVSGNWTIGSAVQYRLGRIVKASITYDYSNLFDTSPDWRTKSHFGTELATPLFTVMFGVHQIFPTYGLKLNLWLFNIFAGSYKEDLNSVAGTYPQRRYFLNFAFKFDF